MFTGISKAGHAKADRAWLASRQRLVRGHGARLGAVRTAASGTVFTLKHMPKGDGFFQNLF